MKALRKFPDYSLSKDECSIFLFHGVVKSHEHPVKNYIRKHIDARSFEAFLRDLLEIGTPLRLADYLACEQELPPYSFCVTFDDGFENNYSVAAPILEALAVPAMLYVTTDWVENNHMSWVDRAEGYLEAAGKGELKLSILKGARAFSNDEDKIKIMSELRTVIKAEPGIDTEGMLREMCEQCRVSPIESSSDALDKKLTWNQVRELAQRGTYEIGGHTHTHPIMSFLSEAQCRSEIEICLSKVEQNLGFRPSHFAYPDGQAAHYNAGVISLLKEAGVTCSPTAISGTNPAKSDPFTLKRTMVVI